MEVDAAGRFPSESMAGGPVGDSFGSVAGGNGIQGPPFRTEPRLVGSEHLLAPPAGQEPVSDGDGNKCLGGACRICCYDEEVRFTRCAFGDA